MLTSRKTPFSIGGQETIAGEKSAAGNGDKNWEALLALTPRELQILSTLATSGRPEDVELKLSLSSGTVRNHIKHILAKTGPVRISRP